MRPSLSGQCHTSPAGLRSQVSFIYHQHARTSTDIPFPSLFILLSLASSSASPTASARASNLTSASATPLTLSGQRHISVMLSLACLHLIYTYRYPIHRARALNLTVAAAMPLSLSGQRHAPILLNREISSLLVLYMGTSMFQQVALLWILHSTSPGMEFDYWCCHASFTLRSALCLSKMTKILTGGSCWIYLDFKHMGSHMPPNWRQLLGLLGFHAHGQPHATLQVFLTLQANSDPRFGFSKC